MQSAVIPDNEPARLRAVRLTGLLDTVPEHEFDDIASLAARLCRTPIALICLLDSDRQWFKSNVGLAGATQTPRSLSFCAHAILQPDLLVVQNASLDARFHDNPLVTGEPRISFYAGVPLVDASGHALGTLCVLDHVPRELSTDQTAVLLTLRDQVVRLIDMKQMVRQLTLALDQREHSERRLRWRTLHDPLTRLANRVMLGRRIEICLARARSDPSYRFALLYLDLDRFKLVNDSLGHRAGDEMLRAVAVRLRTTLRQTRPRQRADTIARLGGDEFCVLLDGADDLRTVREIGDALIHSLRQPVTCGQTELETGASMGVVVIDQHSLPHASRDVLRDADVAMYHAKQTGGSRQVLFDPSMHQRVVHKLDIENALRGVTTRDELYLDYQPIVSLDTGAVIGFEALLRWNRPGHGKVAPMDFITIAEECGLIIPIGNWVIDEVARQLRVWASLHGLDPFYVTVNLSRRQLADQSFLNHLRGALDDGAFPAERIKLEITETSIVEDGERSIEMLRGARALGVGVLMDDFGTGQSSLSSLHTFPLDGLKIDRAFIREMGKRRDYAAVVQAVVSLARNLGMCVIAEGAETADQVTMLQGLGCDACQGYYFAKPMPASHVPAYLTGRNLGIRLSA